MSYGNGDACPWGRSAVSGNGLILGVGTIPVKMAMELVLGQYCREWSQTKKQTIPIFAPHRSKNQHPQACLAQVQAQMEQVPSSLAQVRFYGLYLLHEMPFYALQWRRSPTQNRTCAICRNTCSKKEDTCAICRNTCTRKEEACSICRNTCAKIEETCSKTTAPAPTRA